MVDVLNMGINSTGEYTLAQCIFFSFVIKTHSEYHWSKKYGASLFFCSVKPLGLRLTRIGPLLSSTSHKQALIPTRGVLHYGLAIYIRKYLNAKEELCKLKYFTMQKIPNLQKNPLKETKKILQEIIIITLL